MVITALDHVPHCYTADDGLTIQRLVDAAMRRGEDVELSFAGVHAAVPSSFVNAAFVGLLERYGLDTIKRSLKITNSTRQINEMIRSRVNAEAKASFKACA